jgi:5-hydroxyisourate hydrolase-like protein (transthyretin family)
LLIFVVAALLAAGAALAAPRAAQGAVARDNGTITGAVTKADSFGIAGVQVTVYADAGTGRQVVGSTQTNAQGLYAVTAPAGPCWVGFSNPNYVGEFYNNKPTLSTADSVTVTAGQTTPTINAQLASLGSLSGKVTGPDDKALNGMQVTAYIYDGFGHWRPASNTVTASGGKYTVNGLPPGAYRVGFVDPSDKYLGEYYDNKYAIDKASDITVYAGTSTPNVDAQLVLPASIQGKVTNADAEGVSGIGVRIFLDDGNDHWYAVGNTTTQGSGGYLVENLPAGNLRVQFSDATKHYLTQFYNAAAALTGGADVATTAGQASSGIDAKLVVASRIAGVVKKPNGKPLLGIKVAAQKKSGDSWKTAGMATSNANGKYVVSSLPAGTYRIKFIDTTGVYVNEFFKDQLMPDKAESITLAVGVLHKAVSAKLAVAGRIGGVVHGKGNKPLAKMQATAFRKEGTSWIWAGTATTGPTGAYRLVGLAEGTYRVRFSDPNGKYVTAYYQSADKIDNATDINVRSGHTTWSIGLRLVLKTT